MRKFGRAIFTAGILVSAFLLFLVQPMAGKMLLPHFGGTPAVWNTCMVFFQAMLLAGYLYAHLGDRILGSKRHAGLHLVVVFAALWFVPFSLEPASMEAASHRPVTTVLRLLFVSLGVPFFCLSATSPMLQRWFSRTDDPRADDPYFLYAASNVGSLLALVSYPLVIEAWTSVGTQRWSWAVGFGASALLIGASAFLLWAAQPAAGEGGRAEAQKGAGPEEAEVGAARRFGWVVHAFVPSSLMLGVTTYLTTDIAAAPLLWVVPFVIYLGTFILAFSERVEIPRDELVRATPLVLVPVLFFFAGGHRLADSAWFLGAVHLAVFAVLAMVFHGELAAERPPTSHLTEFYFWVSFGGMLGGIFNALVAPVVFDWPVEYPVVLAVAAVALPVGPLEALRFDGETLRSYVLPGLILSALFGWSLDGGFDLLFWSVVAVFVFFAIIYMASHRYRRLFGLGFGIAALGAISLSVQTFEYRYMKRNFFGTNAVKQSDELRYLFNGAMIHGAQYLDEERSSLPVPYYLSPGPVDDVFGVLHARPGPQPVGVIGLGTGGLAMYGRAGEQMTFFEIDPDVVEIARRKFTYLEQSPAEVEIVVGDGRLGLEETPEDSFSLVVVDAFSADAIPTHLATREAIQMYFSRMRRPGILLFHVSNKYVDMRPLLANTAEDLGMVAYSAVHKPEEHSEFEDLFAEKTMWVAVARSEDKLGELTELERWEREEPDPEYPVWTDDYSNIVRVLR